MPAIKKLKELLSSGKITLLDFFKALRKNRKEKRERIIKQAIYGDSPTTKCQVSSSNAASYFKTILSSASTPALYATTHDVSPTWTVDDVKDALNKCSNTSSPGLDKVTFSELKLRNPEDIVSTFNKVCTSATPEPGWADAIVTLIFKKDDKSDPKCYRPIAVSPAITRVYHRILARWLQHFISENNVLSPAQKGFIHKVNGLSQHVLSLSSEISRATKTNVLLLDLQKAFDSVDHDALFHRLNEIGLPSWFQRYIFNFYKNATVTIKCSEGTRTDPIPVQRGCLQGDPLSPLLFCIAFDPALRNLPCAVRAYADDVALSSTSLDDLQAAVLQFEEKCSPLGLRLNPKKCQFAQYCKGKQVLNSNIIYISGQPLKTSTETLKYLGIPIVNQETAINEKLSARLSNLNSSGLTSRQKTSALRNRLLPDLYFFFQNSFLLCDLTRLDTVISEYVLKWNPSYTFVSPFFLPGYLVKWLQASFVSTMDRSYICTIIPDVHVHLKYGLSIVEALGHKSHIKAHIMCEQDPIKIYNLDVLDCPSDRIYAFFNGFCEDKIGGCGVYIQFPDGRSIEQCFPFSGTATNQKTKCMALLEACKTLHDYKQCVFLSDCKSLLASLKYPSFKKLIRNVREMLSGFSDSRLQWISNHYGVRKAGTLARLGFEGHTIMPCLHV